MTKILSFFILFYCISVCLEELLTYEQYQFRQIYQYTPAFQLHTLNTIVDKIKQSYLLSIFHDLYLKLLQEWHIDRPILDHNLTRLSQLATKYGFPGQTPSVVNGRHLLFTMENDNSLQ